jgi:hypothetical protein
VASTTFLTAIIGSRQPRALGSDYISAHVTEVVELSHYDAQTVRV